MSKQTINIGASPNDGTGTPLRTSFDYTNQNFTEIYTALGGGVALPGATTQVIFNDGGTNLAGDAGLVYNKTTDALTVAGLVTAGSATITGDLTVDTSTLKVDSTNNRVGIGTTTPAYKLEVATGTSGQQALASFRTADTTAANNAGIQIYATPSSTAASRSVLLSLDADGADASGGDYFYIQKLGNSGTVEFNQSSNAAMTFLTNATERYRIASDGVATWSNVGGVAGTAMTLNSTGLGIGTASPTAALDVYRAEVSSAAGTTAIITNITGGGNRIAALRLQNLSNQWNIRAIGSGDTFRIGTGAAGSEVDYLTLDASGNLLIATTTANGRVAVDADLAVYNGMAVKNTGTTYSASSFFFRFINSSGVTAGSIQHTAVTTTNYSTTSDSRLKESKGISTDTSVIDNTIVRDFVWKADGSTDRGVFAQEAQSVKPRAISAGSDDLTEDGNIKTPWSVDYSKFVPDLIVYCQQLKKQVVELTARVETLEAK